MARMNVTLRITGDALIYERNDLWNVAFVTDQHHVLDIKENGPSLRPGGFRKPDLLRHMFILPDGPVNAGRHRGPRFSDILNLNEIHDLDSNGRSKLVTNYKPANGREIIHLAVPLGTLDAEEVVCDYWYEEYPGGARQYVGHDTATVVTLRFDLNGAFGLAVSDSNGAEQLSWPNRLGPLDLHFDNHCYRGHQGGREDFLSYYDWVQEKNTNRRFIAGKVICKQDKKGVIRRSPEGNCDPPVIDPPPGP